MIFGIYTALFGFLQELLSAAVGFIKVNPSTESIRHPNLVVTMSLVSLMSENSSVILEQGIIIFKNNARLILYFMFL